jgi:3-deoxy-D-manno-octulosonic-acid transferase
MNELSQRKIPSYLISSVFRKSQLFFRWYGAWYLDVLRKFNWISVQDQDSNRILGEFGIKNVSITGDTRIDRVIERSKQTIHIQGISEFLGNNQAIVAGSSWPQEEDLLLRFLKDGMDVNYKLILCPHDISEKHLDSIKNKFRPDIISYSELLIQGSQQRPERVLLIDRIGLLAGLYQYGRIAVIGGAFGKGLHNILEPAVFGLPVVFGPSYHKFVEAVDLVKFGGGFSVNTYETFRTVLRDLISDEDTLLRAGKGCRAYVEKNKGATALIISHLLEKDQQ